jgi:hypothetical protein
MKAPQQRGHCGPERGDDTAEHELAVGRVGVDGGGQAGEKG